MRRYINSADALNTLKHLAYETALNQHDPYVADVFEDIAKNRLETWVDLIPTADVLEVVRCKDCKHKPKHPPGYDYGHYLEFPDDICPCQCDDPWHSMKPEDNFFCAKGERNNE